MSTDADNKQLIIGLSGKKRHGKDATALLLVEELCRHRTGPIIVRSLACSLKDEVAVFLAPMLLPMPFYSVRDLLDSKEHKEDFRLLMQWWGSFRRNYFGENYWIERMSDWIERQPVNAAIIISDMRYENEAEFVKSRGGVCIRVERPGYGKADSHVSETSLDNYTGFDDTVVNDGGLGDLHNAVRVAYKDLFCKP